MWTGSWHVKPEPNVGTILYIVYKTGTGTTNTVMVPNPIFEYVLSHTKYTLRHCVLSYYIIYCPSLGYVRLGCTFFGRLKRTILRRYVYIYMWVLVHTKYITFGGSFMIIWINWFGWRAWSPLHNVRFGSETIPDESVGWTRNYNAGNCYYNYNSRNFFSRFS